MKICGIIYGYFEGIILANRDLYLALGCSVMFIEGDVGLCCHLEFHIE